MNERKHLPGNVRNNDVESTGNGRVGIQDTGETIITGFPPEPTPCAGFLVRLSTLVFSAVSFPGPPVPLSRQGL